MAGQSIVVCGVMRRLTVKFFSLSKSKKRLLIEAFFYASVAFVMIRLLPYRVWRKRLGVPVLPPVSSYEASDLVSEGPSELSDILWTYASLYRNARFFTCLMLALSARAVLHRRDLKSILVLGVDRGKIENKSKFLAHAWVVYQGRDVSGGELKHKYAAVAAYSID